MENRGQQPALTVGSGRGNARRPLQVGGGQRQTTAGRLLARQPLQLRGQVLVGVIQGRHPVGPCACLIDEGDRPCVQLPSPLRGHAGVDRVALQSVTDHHLATRLVGRQVRQSRPHGRHYRRARLLHPCRHAQQNQRHRPVNHGQHLKQRPGRRGQHGELVPDGRGQRRRDSGRPPAELLQAPGVAEQGLQVQRVTAGAIMQALDGVGAQRPGSQRGGEWPHLIDAQPGQQYVSPLRHADEHPAGRFIQLLTVTANGEDHHDRVHR
jgi:hypothetical protein